MSNGCSSLLAELQAGGAHLNPTVLDSPTPTAAGTSLEWCVLQRRGMLSNSLVYGSHQSVNGMVK